MRTFSKELISKLTLWLWKFTSSAENFVDKDMCLDTGTSGKKEQPSGSSKHAPRAEPCCKEVYELDEVREEADAKLPFRAWKGSFIESIECTWSDLAYLYSDYIEYNGLDDIRMCDWQHKVQNQLS